MESKHTIKDLVFDDKNFNKGNPFGESLIEKSFDKFGAGRSILLDKNNRIIAGNKSTQKYAESGGENVIIIESDGKSLIAVKRTDIDLDSQEGREFALADNATSKANIVWAEDIIAEEIGIETAESWAVKIENISDSDDFGTEFSLKDGDKAPFQQMTFTLADEQAEQIKNAIKDIKETEEYKYCETMGNENTNGNALYLIIMQWVEQRR